MGHKGRHRLPGLERGFLAVWTGQTVSLFGDYVAYLTVPLFLLTLSDRPFDFGLVSAAENLPTLLFGFAGGVLLDRFSLRPILIIGDLLRAASFFVLAAVAGSASFEPWMLIPFSFIVGSLAASFTAGLQSFVPSIVPAYMLTTANSRLSLSQQMAFLFGPPAGGLIVQSAGYAAAFIFNGLTFVVSAASFLLIDRPIDRALPSGGRFLDDVRAGWSHLWGDTRIRLTTLAGSLGNFVTGFTEAALVLVGAKILGTDEPAQLGFFVVGMGVGGILGAASAARVTRIFGIGPAFVVGLVLYGAGLFAVTFANQLLLVGLILVAAFVGLVWVNVAMTTMRQLYTPARLLGRVTATARAIAWGTLPFGALFGTALAQRIGVLTIMRIGTVAIVAFALFLISTAVWTAPSTVEESGG